MNKGDFVAAVSDAAGLTKVDGAKAVEAFIETVKKALKKGETVALVGFGTFVVRKRAARTGRNPRTGAADQDQGFEESVIQGWQSAQGCHKLTRFRPCRA